MVASAVELANDEACGSAVGCSVASSRTTNEVFGSQRLFDEAHSEGLGEEGHAH